MSQTLLPLTMSKSVIDFEHYHPTESACHSLLKTLDTQTLTQSVYLWGPSGSGKTHLLQATAKHQLSLGKQVCYLPCEDCTTLSATYLSELNAYDVVLLDNLSTVLNQPLWQQALFTLLNSLLQHPKHRIVMADQNNADALGCDRDDLLTRLRAGTTFYLPPLSDTALKSTIIERITDSGMHLAEKTLDFLLHHTSRNPKDIFAQLHFLDQASLQLQHPITIPFIKTQLPKFSIEGLTAK